MISLSRTKLKQKRSSPSRESPLQPTRFATALANLALALSSGWALRKTGFDPYVYSSVTFGLLFLHSVIGIVRFGNPQYGENVRPLYELTVFLCIIIGLPCLSAQFAAMYSMPYAIMCLIVPSLVVAIVYFMLKYFEGVKVGDVRSVKTVPVCMIVIMSLAFLVFTSSKNFNYYGIAASMAYAHTYFIIGPTGTAFNLPAVDLFLYELVFFNYFAVKALLD